MITTVPQYIALVAEVQDITRRSGRFRLLVGDADGQYMIAGEGMVPSWLKVGSRAKFCVQLIPGVKGGLPPHMKLIEAAHPRG